MPADLTIAIDATGGYGAPSAVVEAVGELSRTAAAGTYYALVGPHDWIAEVLVRTRHNPEKIAVISSDQPIDRACELIAAGEADALVTAGNPAAVVAAAQARFQMVPSIDRAALATVFPTWDSNGGEQFSLILDVGASFRASAEHLVQFAQMGVQYARIVTGHAEPSVALLSSSPDPLHGPDEVTRAVELLSNTPLNFVGTVDGYQVPRGGIDVIVCEGFAGDLTTKVIEGFADAAFEMAENAYHRKFAYKMGLKLLLPGLRKIRRAVDFEEYGGAPLLGFDKVVIVADPRSSPRAFANAVKLAAKSVRSDLPSQIAAATS